MNEKQVKDNRRLRQEKIDLLRKVVNIEPLTQDHVIISYDIIIYLWQLDEAFSAHQRKAGKG